MAVWRYITSFVVCSHGSDLRVRKLCRRIELCRRWRVKFPCAQVSLCGFGTSVSACVDSPTFGLSPEAGTGAVNSRAEDV